MKAAVAVLLLMSSPTIAQEVSFDAGLTEACLADGGGRDCIGVSAETCAATPAGGTTVGLGFCYGAERDWWDGKLNAAYADLMAAERAIDADTAETGRAGLARADALRAMQRAWIAFRDAACLYEYSRWGGGTGGNPAHAACAMRETAEQTLVLQARLDEGP